jgi:hypothetical protein
MDESPRNGTSHLNKTDFGRTVSGLIVCVPPDSNPRWQTSMIAKGEFELALHENSIHVSDQCPDPDGLTKESSFAFNLLVCGP